MENTTDYRIVTETEEAREYLDGAKVIAFDFETAPRAEWREDALAALDAHKADIVGVSFSVAPGTGIYIPLAHRDGGNADPEAVIPLLRDMVWENPEVVKIAHNMAFESMFLYAHGIILREPVYDTIAAAQMTLKSPDEFRSLNDSGLKTLVPNLFGIQLPSFTEVVTRGLSARNRTRTAAVVPARAPHATSPDPFGFDMLSPNDPETIRYACADSDFALRLYDRFNEWFDRWLPGHRWIVEHVESPTSVYCGLMKYNGLPMDRETMIRKQGECSEKLNELRWKIHEITGNVDIGANCGTKAFKDYLFQDLKLPVLKTTEKNAEAADDQTMQMLAEWCKEHKPELVPLFELVQEYRKWGKLKTTYLDGYLKYINPATGRIHPDQMPLATDTGRFACRNPNMQNCPRKSNDPIGIRSFIKAPDGWRLVSCDFSQIELRVGSFYCRDPKMLEVYRTGGDIHAQTTSIIYGVPYEQAKDKNDPDYKERRTVAKGVNFGLFFGLFPKGLQQQLKYKGGLNPSLEECAAILASIRAGYPRLSAWQEETKRKAAGLCYTETHLGRRRYLPGIMSTDWGRRSFAERCALNTPIQGTAADILKLAMGRMIDGLAERPWIRPVLQIHDELVFLVEENHVKEGVCFVKECMEEKPFPGFDVPLVAEAAVGKDFGNLEEV